MYDIPPETFFVDRNARSMDNYYICGHSTDVTVADIIYGFSLDDLAGIDGSNYSTADDEAEFERRGMQQMKATTKCIVFI